MSPTDDNVIFLRALIMGEAKVGKTCCIVDSACRAFGPGFVIESSTDAHLTGARKLKTQSQCPWESQLAKAPDEMESAIKRARGGVKEGKYNWILLDDLSMYS